MKESAYYNNISKNIYTSQFAKDTLNGVTDRKLSVARWRPAYQSDFAARAEWLEQSYAEANHPPDARIVGANSRTVRSGDTVTLDAGPSSDPDGDSLSFKWWVYKEASSYSGNVTISSNTNRKASLKVPGVSSQKDLHVILEVKDSGSPSSTRYQRVVLTMNP
ncbi:MAG TPA: REJ domain-containing protein, partial [Geminicoccus sp.]|uniref:REJ domain-containing protein n=1 Tax=Geminicoccus sp. TaxID=2024832 RepID=UPI002E2FD59C